MADKTPVTRSSRSEISDFLKSTELMVSSEPEVSARLMFILDATASRQPTWDRACQLHGEIFSAASQSQLAIQLCYYRGFQEFRATGWLKQAPALLRAMSGVQCLGGQTQIGRVLKHAINEQSKQPVAALVFIGDAVEENVDRLCQQAGELGVRGLPIFIFQDGREPHASAVFKQLAKLSCGAHFQLDGNSAQQLAELLRAAANYASGGKSALRALNSSAAQALLQQLPGSQ